MVGGHDAEAVGERRARCGAVRAGPRRRSPRSRCAVPSARRGGRVVERRRPRGGRRHGAGRRGARARPGRRSSRGPRAGRVASLLAVPTTSSTPWTSRVRADARGGRGRPGRRVPLRGAARRAARDAPEPRTVQRRRRAPLRSGPVVVGDGIEHGDLAGSSARSTASRRGRCRRARRERDGPGALPDRGQRTGDDPCLQAVQSRFRDGLPCTWSAPSTTVRPSAGSAVVTTTRAPASRSPSTTSPTPPRSSESVFTSRTGAPAARIRCAACVTAARRASGSSDRVSQSRTTSDRDRATCSSAAGSVRATVTARRRGPRRPRRLRTGRRRSRRGGSTSDPSSGSVDGRVVRIDGMHETR